MTQECKGMIQECKGMTEECKGMKQPRKAHMTGQVAPANACQSLLMNGQQGNADSARPKEWGLGKGVGEGGGGGHAAGSMTAVTMTQVWGEVLTKFVGIHDQLSVIHRRLVCQGLASSV